MTKQSVVLGLGGLILCIPMGCLIVRVPQPRGSAGLPSMVRRIAADSGHRTLEARLTGFPYRPLRGTMRSGTSPSPANELRAAILEAQEAAEIESTDVARYAIAIGRAFIGEYDLAVAALDSVGTAASADLLSDLAAVLITRAGSGETPLADYARAIDAAGWAIASSSGHVEAHFNRALAIERAGLKVSAASAWQSYLQLEPEGGWSDEARDHLARLDQGQPCAPQGATEAECTDPASQTPEVMLSLWAASAVDRRADSATIDAAIHDLAAESPPRDSLATDAARTILRSDLRCRQILAQAHRRYAAARQEYDSDRRHEAFGGFVQSAAQFRLCNSSYWLWAELYAAIVDVHSRRLTDAIARVNRIEKVASAKQFHPILARSQWLRGSATLHLAGPAAALPRFHTALDRYRHLGDLAATANVANAAADAHRIIGELAAGWRLLHEAISKGAAANDPTRRYLVFYNTSLYCLRSGMTEAALAFQDEAVVAVRHRRGQGGLLEALTNRAAILAALGRSGEAFTALEEAQSVSASLTDPQQVAYMQARFAAVRGQVRLADDPQAAQADLTAAIEHFKDVESAELPRLLRLRAQALGAAGQSAAASDDLLTAARAFEAQRATLTNDTQRVSFAEEGWAVSEARIELSLSRGQPDDAFALAEQARARTLRATGDSLLSPEQAASRLPAGVTVLFYLVLKTDVHVWTLTSSGARHARIGISRGDLERRVNLVRWQIAAIGGGGRALDAQLSALHRDLIETANVPTTTRQLIVIPDRILSGLPVNALRDSNGRFLVEKFEIAMAPALELFLTRSGEREQGSLLKVSAIGDPEFPAGRFALPRLPAAADEARGIGQIYPGAVVLTGRSASRSAVLESFRNADVIHFAGHAIANMHFPDLSRLVVASDDDDLDQASISAAEIASVGVRSGALVVLSACRSGDGDIRASEGPQSLGRAFLAAGAGSVMVSLWDVEDRATRDLFLEFHSEFSRGRDAARALGEAQKAMIRSGMSVHQWAAFVAIVGGKSAG